MRGNRFLVILAHPSYGRIKRFSVPHTALHVAFGVAVLALVAAIGLSANYLRQSSQAERLAAENELLLKEFNSLQLTIEERDRQLESLNGLAYQLSIAYGIRRDALEAEAAHGTHLLPAFYASLNQYDLIRDALAESRLGLPMQTVLANTTPSIWPVKGHITSSYGTRQDPFTGQGSFHPGIDISAPYGTPVVATADGHVVSAEWEGALGHCVQIQHGRSGFSTAYGHLKGVLRDSRPVDSPRRSPRACRDFGPHDRQTPALRSSPRPDERQSVSISQKQGTVLLDLTDRLSTRARRHGIVPDQSDGLTSPDTKGICSRSPVHGDFNVAGTSDDQETDVQRARTHRRTRANSRSGRPKQVRLPRGDRTRESS